MIHWAQSMPPQLAWTQNYGLLESSGPALSAPWRYAALAQVRNLEETGQNRPGQGDLRISERTSAHARQVIAQVNITELPTPEVAPISGGGIAISWGVGNREVQLSVFSDGEVVFLRTENSTILDEPDGSPEERYVAGLEWLLARAA